MDKLAESAENIDVPESLKPENVQILLGGLERQDTSSSVENEPSESTASKRKPVKITPRKTKWATTAIAACLTIVCGLGILATGLSPNSSTVASNNAAESDSSISQVPVAASYDELYGILNATKSANSEDQDIPISGLKTAETGTPKNSPAEKNASQDSATANSFSKTNLRTEGVEEGDIVKTDGNVIYTLQNYNNQLTLVKASEGKMKKASTIKAKDVTKKYGDFTEFFVDNNRLYLIMDVYREDSSGNSTTKVVTYDVSDPNSPKKIGDVDQTGYYNSARLVDGYLYLFTNFYPKYDAKKSKIREYVPCNEKDVVPYTDIYVPSCADGSDYLVVSSINTSNPSKLMQTKAVLSGASEIYVSNDSIYLYGPKRLNIAELARENDDSENDTSETDSSKKKESSVEDTADVDLGVVDVYYPFASDATVICKLSYKDGQFDSIGETTVSGIVDDGFSIDEYQGNTRIITTLYGNNDKTSTNVYVLNDELNEIGSLTDLAPGEKVYSARFMGDIGYFVTYKQVDPLFSVDFSDPTKPTIIGQLKIPGFSEYLHPWGEGRLLGIGQATDKKGETTEGIKISMFDTSDPTNVRELDTYVIKNAFWAQVLSNYKAVYIDEEKGLVGFSAEGMKEIYYLFSYSDEKGFSEVLTDKISKWSDLCEARGISIGDIFYVVSQGSIDSYNMNGFKKISAIKL